MNYSARHECFNNSGRQGQPKLSMPPIVWVSGVSQTRIGADRRLTSVTSHARCRDPEIMSKCKSSPPAFVIGTIRKSASDNHSKVVTTKQNNPHNSHTKSKISQREIYSCATVLHSLSFRKELTFFHLFFNSSYIIISILVDLNE